MSFIRRLFGASNDDSEQTEAPTDTSRTPTTPADEPPAEAEVAPAEPPAEAEVAPAPAGPPTDQTDWWASSVAAADATPARKQSAEVQHPNLPTELTSLDDSEAPTAPVSAITEEQAQAYLAEQSASDATTPPEGIAAVATDAMEGTRQLEADSTPALSAHRSSQGLAAMALRDIGRVREVNQDSVFAMLTTLPRASSDVTIGLFIVADGMGGHQGGEVASRLAVRTVVYHVLSQLVMPALDESMTEALQPLMISAVQAANEAIWDSAQVMGTDMGTTCTAALLVGHGLYIAHVGDSRAYLFEPGGLRPLTADHSTVGRLIQLGQLDPSEAREHPLRNQLYRTIGQQPQVMVDFVYQPMGQSSHLLICSDGLWGLLDEPLMAQALTRSPWPQDACEELIALANLAGGDDNISAVVVSLPMTER